jgi:hypothetical protein
MGIMLKHLMAEVPRDGHEGLLARLPLRELRNAGMPANARRIAKRLTAIIGDRPFQFPPFSSGWLVAPAGEWHLTANGELRKGVGNLHAQFPILTAD